MIAETSVVKWHEWGAKPFNRPDLAGGRLMGWQYCGGTYSGFHATREEFANFGTCEISEDWKCDIQEVTGLAASKSDLARFASLDVMAETVCRGLIDDITEKKLRENLAHNEIRILHDNASSDHFARYLWDGRIFLMNTGGSHHFAAARYIAARLAVAVPLRGKLRTYCINPTAVAGLSRDCEMFLRACPKKT